MKPTEAHHPVVINEDARLQIQLSDELPSQDIHSLMIEVVNELASELEKEAYSEGADPPARCAFIDRDYRCVCGKIGPNNANSCLYTVCLVLRHADIVKRQG